MYSEPLLVLDIVGSSADLSEFMTRGRRGGRRLAGAPDPTLCRCLTNVPWCDFTGMSACLRFTRKVRVFHYKCSGKPLRAYLLQVWHSFVQNKGPHRSYVRSSRNLINTTSAGHDVQCFPNVRSHMLNSRDIIVLRYVFSLRYCRRNQEW